jgi:hypothetical protein
MTTSEQMRRLEQLEAQARVAELEQQRHDPELRAQAAAYAERLDLNVDELIEESLRIARHIAEVGEGAWRAECEAEEREWAAQYGISLERYRAIDWDAEHADWVAEGSITGAWRGRDWNTWPARLVAEPE